MLVYSALIGGFWGEEVTNLSSSIYRKYKPNNLITFYDKTFRDNFKDILSMSENLLVDSGAFSMLNSPKPMDVDKYFQEYLRFVKKNTNNDKITGFFELDIDSIIGYDKVKQYRNKLLNVSDKIIPVWHKNLGIGEFKQMCKDYDYIALGGIVIKEIPKTQAPIFLKYAHNHNTKLHALGLTDVNYLKKYPFDSVDSTSWYRSRFGNRTVFRNGKYETIKVNSNYLKNNSTKIKVLEYIESLKFQNYYKKYWGVN